jgi:hypothetical protein
VQIVNLSQGVTAFSHQVYTLQMVTLPADGVASGVTSPDRFDVTMGSWGQVSTPYWGYPDQMTWSWLNVPVPSRLQVIFGVGYPGFPTPEPIPQQRLYGLMGQPGNSTWAFNLRYLRKATTARDEGWGGLVRLQGRTRETFFSNGVARLPELNATVAFEQIADTWVAAVFTLTNQLDVDVVADLMFSCATAASTINFQELAPGVFHFDGWDLKLMRYSLGGVPCNTLDRFTPSRDSWESARSFVGQTDGISFAWTGRSVPAQGSIELRTIFGVGDNPRWPTPVPTASTIPRASATRSPTRSAVPQTEAPALPDATAVVPGSKSSSGLSAGAIAGVAVGAAALVAITAVAVYCLVHRKPGPADDELEKELVSEPAFRGGIYT